MSLLEPVLLRSEVFSNPLIGVHMRWSRAIGLFSESGWTTRRSAKLRLLFFVVLILWVLQATTLMVSKSLKGRVQLMVDPWTMVSNRYERFIFM